MEEEDEWETGVGGGGLLRHVGHVIKIAADSTVRKTRTRMTETVTSVENITVF